MPNGDLVESIWVEMIDDYQGNADKYEVREKQYGAHKAMLDDTSLIPSGGGIISETNRSTIEEAGYSTNGTSIPVMNNDTYTINATSFNTCIASQEGNDSALLDVTYNTISTEFFIPVTKGLYNYVTTRDYMMKSMNNLSRDLNVYINSLALQALIDARGQDQTDLLNYFIDSGDDSFSVANADKDSIMLNIRTLYNNNDFDGGYRLVGNPVYHRDATYPQFAQGTGNAVNTNYQYSGSPSPNVMDGIFGLGDDFAMYSDNQLTNIAGAQSSAFVFPEGSTAIVDSVDKRFTSELSNELINARLDETIIPGVVGGYNWGMRVTDACTNGIDGISMQWETKLAFITPYNSDQANTFGAINRFEIQESV